MGAKFRRKFAAGQNNRFINRAARYLDMRLSGLEQALTITLKYLEGKDPEARKAMEGIAAEMRSPNVAGLTTQKSTAGIPVPDELNGKSLVTQSELPATD